MLPIRSPFDYDGDMVSEETGLECKDVTLTQQSGKEEADINTLVKRFGLTGELPQNVRMPMEEEFVGAMTFRESMNVIREAEVAFMEMPAHVRERFNHDPGNLVAFVSVPENHDEARKLGLVVPEAAPVVDEPLLVQVVPAIVPGAPGAP